MKYPRQLLSMFSILFMLICGSAFAQEVPPEKVEQNEKAETSNETSPEEKKSESITEDETEENKAVDSDEKGKSPDSNSEEPDSQNKDSDAESGEAKASSDEQDKKNAQNEENKTSDKDSNEASTSSNSEEDKKSTENNESTDNTSVKPEEDNEKSVGNNDPPKNTEGAAEKSENDKDSPENTTPEETTEKSEDKKSHEEKNTEKSEDKKPENGDDKKTNEIPVKPEEKEPQDNTESQEKKNEEGTSNEEEVGDFDDNTQKEKTVEEKKTDHLEILKYLKSDSDSIPKIIKILDYSNDEKVHLLGIEILGKIGPSHPRIVPTLINLSNTDSEEIQERILEIFSAPEAKEQLRKIVAAPGVQRKPAAGLLSKMGEEEVPVFWKLLQKEDNEGRVIAVDALSNMGLACIPGLMKLLEKSEEVGDLNNLLKIFKKIGPQSIPIMLYSIDIAQGMSKNFALQTIAYLGTEGWMESIRILRITQNEALEELVVDSSALIGVDLLPAVVPLLNDRLPIIRRCSQKILTKLSDKALPALLKIVETSEKPELKNNALIAIGALGEKAKSATPLIRKLLTSNDEQIQLSAVLSLEKMGEHAKVAVDDLNVLLRTSKNWRTRVAVANTLGNIGPGAQSALPTMITQLRKDEYGDVRVALCRAIGKMGPVAKSAVSALIVSLKDEDETVVKSAAEALGEIGPDAKRAVKNLIEVLMYWGPNERVIAAKSLAKIGQRAIPTLVQTLRSHQDMAAREGAAMAIGFMGKSAGRAVSALVLALKYDVDIVKLASAVALGKIGPTSSSAVKALVDALQSEQQIVQKAASDALLKMGPETIPHLISAIRSLRDTKSRIAVLEIFGQFGEKSSPAITSLLDCLKYWRGPEREKVILVIPKLGESAQQAVPILIDILKESNKMEKVIQESLVAIGPSVIPAVLPLLGSDLPGVRDTASSVLEKMQDNALPHLVKIVQNSDSDSLVCTAINILCKNVKSVSVIIDSLKHRSQQVRASSVKALAYIGEPAIKDTVNLLTSTQISYEREAASATLGLIGDAAVPALVKVIDENDNEITRLSAIDALLAMGVNAKDAVVDLVDGIKKRKGNEQIKLAKCLGKIGVQAIPEILKLLEEQDINVQRASIIALGETNSEDAIVYLLKSLKNPNLLSLVVDATVKMKNIATPILISSLNSEDPTVRFSCAAALFEISSSDAIAELAKRSLVENNPMVKHMVELALRRCQESVQEDK